MFRLASKQSLAAIRSAGVRNFGSKAQFNAANGSSMRLVIATSVLAAGVAGAAYASSQPVLLDEKKVKSKKAKAEKPEEKVEDPKKEGEGAGEAKEKEEAKGEAQEGEAEGEGQQAAAYNPETGEINWDCPCLGGMAHGPCGEEFKDAFSCFVYSAAEPKGVDCIEKFRFMQDCFRKYPDVYSEEIRDDESVPVDEPVESTPQPAAEPAQELKEPAFEQPVEPTVVIEEPVVIEETITIEEPKN